MGKKVLRMRVDFREKAGIFFRKEHRPRERGDISTKELSP